RRAMRHAQLLGASEPLMWRLVPALVREMGQAYPELVRGQALITETLKLEESRFRKTLERGLGLLDEATADLGESGTLDGRTAFRLYDTYGFPLDLTQDALKGRGLSVDVAGFNAAMEAQKQEARAAWKGSGEAATEAVWFQLRERLGATEFLGYSDLTAEGVVTGLVRDGKDVTTLSAGDEGALIANQTPFYGESGGQVGDVGVITSPEGLIFHVTDTQKKADGLIVHLGRVESGKVETGHPVELSVDYRRRQSTRANHSATHLLHEALRQTLGDHVAQKGSMVSPDRLRFDFAHPKSVDAEDLSRVEDIANAMVLQDGAVETRLMAVDDAIASGARALFGEKYGDEVRVVTMGTNIDGDLAGRPFSVELCGGTHVARTGEIGLVRVLSESAVSSGVRRVEALTGDAARAYLDRQDQRVRGLAATLKVPADQVEDRVRALVDERRALEREVADLRRQVALGGGGSSGAGAHEEIGGVKLAARRLDGVPAKDLKGIADGLKGELESGVVALVAVSEDGKAAIVAAVTGDLVGRFDAVALVRAASEAVGGKGGGGRPDMAQAGGPDGARADAALDAVREILRKG
ncbi:MAG: alanine--tRNA ligase, partial [Hyphomicrobiaceae bacterium]|nr:alanine--tRNA ligase [Hyphomicrobiaceae bacterium]